MPVARRAAADQSLRPKRSALLTLLATMAILLGSGMAAASFSATGDPAPETTRAPIGIAAIGTAPVQEATGTSGIGTAPERANPPASRGDRQDPNESGSQEIRALEDRVTELTNDARVVAECDQELSTDERLRTAARGHSADMAERGYFDHTTPEGRTPSDRAQAAGFPGGVGENIAMGYRTPEAVMDGWMNSDGHRRNLLNCGYTVIGVGLAYDQQGRPYWTQNFGRG